ncbi:MAG: PSD1 domain-containing protein [Planctomycetales bacterium]|nr:PSD1 domain-containing protein [Planctomycetales bacterium]
MDKPAEISANPCFGWSEGLSCLGILRQWSLSVLLASSFFICHVVTQTGGVASEPTTSQLTDDELEFFEKSVRPLLIRYCYDCHGESEQNGHLRLDSRSGWQLGGDSGPALKPGETNSSLIWQAVQYQDPDLRMPPDARLPDAALAVLHRWIEMGAPDPRTGPATSASPSSALSARGLTIADSASHWAFQPLNAVEVPQVHQRQWLQTPLDAFVLHRLEEAGIAPAPPAPRVELIRRVTFDLIGLPPTPEEVDRFVHDPMPDAYTRLVDRLLASPHFGERWGRHWLDVARYADSNGLDENLAYGNAWRYRDYVIQSYNENKPFDQFAIEQIAGDLLPTADRSTKTATGFLALGAKVLAEPDRDKLVMDTVDEQIDTFGKAFLGLTLGCARCHDHKFDPISQDDYYALAAIFKSTRTFGDTAQGAIKHWYEHSFSTESERSALSEIDKQIQAKQAEASRFKSKTMSELRNAAVQRVADYLTIAAQFQPSASLNEIAALAEPLNLHPRILYHCRLYLAYHPNDPFTQWWQESVAQMSSADLIRSKIEHLFAPDSLDETVEPSLVELREHARKLLGDATGLIAVPPQPEFAFSKADLETYYRLMESARKLESASADENAAMGVCDGEILANLPVHIRGSHRNLGHAVHRGLPKALQAGSSTLIWPRHQSGRLELARWMVYSQQALAARVYVNRVWRWQFGGGLVATTENFGLLGSQPADPALLDWLAIELIESGWSNKDLLRKIVCSSTYQMSTSHPQLTLTTAIDPNNQLHWKHRLRRLEAEEIRDSILAVAGRLDRKLGGKTIPLRNRQFVFNHTSVDHTRYESTRRAVYLPIVRNNLYPLFEQFNYPDPTMPTGNRSATTVAPQALLLMNDELVLDSAAAFADRVQREYSQQDQRLDFAYQLALGRLPSSRERADAMVFLGTSGNKSKQSRSDQHTSTWTLLCQNLLMCNEFMYVR